MEKITDRMRQWMRRLEEKSFPLRSREPFRTRVVDLGKPRIPAVDNIADTLAVAEGEAHK
jgi:hypothetical protein